MPPERMLSCPFCRQPVSRNAEQCPHCGEAMFEDVPRRGRSRENDQALQFIVPVGVSAWSIVACYAGLIGLLLPFAGLLFAIPALICGIVAVATRRRDNKLGTATGLARAVIGIVLSSIAIVLWGGLLIAFAFSRK